MVLVKLVFPENPWKTGRAMPPRKKHITYREWRSRGETIGGAFIRTVPFQYMWLALALVALLIWLGVDYIKGFQW